MAAARAPGRTPEGPPRQDTIGLMKLLPLAGVPLLLLAPAAASAQASPPGEAYHHFLLGRHLETEGAIDDAVKEYQRAAALDSSSAEILAQLAALYARQDRAREAVEAADAALRLAPRNTEANRVLGFVYASRAGVDSGSGPLEGEAAAYASKAATHLEAARRLDRMPDSSLEMTLARVYLRTGAADKAVPGLGRLVEAEPEPDAVALLAEAYEDSGRGADAASLLESAVSSQPGFLSSLAQLYERQERWEEAASAYEKAIQRNPRNADLKTRMAVALLSSGNAANRDRAVELLEQARQASPAEPRTLYLLSQAQRIAGRLERAEETARLLMQVAPSLAAGPLALAQALAGRRQDAEAMAVLQDAVARFPDDLSVRFEMAAQLERQKRYPEAERQFREVIARDPQHGDALNYLGYMLADRGERLEEAIGFITRALQTDPDNGAYIDSLGWAYFKANRLDLAESHLRKAAERRLTSSVVQDHFGEVLYRLGRYDEAVAAWERALAGDRAEVDGAAIERKLRSARAKGKGRQ